MMKLYFCIFIIAIIVFSCMGAKNAEKVCKYQNTYMVDGTTYSCEGVKK